MARRARKGYPPLPELAALAVATAMVGLGCGPGRPVEVRSAAPAATAAVETESSWRADLDAWIGEREDGLRQPDGWLSLAGLYWLEEGESAFGSDPGNAVVFPAGRAPPRVGVFTVAGGAVRLRVEPGVAVTHRGEPVTTELVLVTDAAGEPTVVELGSLLFHAIDRGGRIAIRLKDRESPLIAAFAGLERFPPDRAWRVQARLERYDPPRTIVVPNIAGPALPEPCPGRLVFEIAGEAYSLEPTGEPGEELFVVFGDATNADETYGGGRFLYADWPGPDGAVVLDFNRAYNPPCVFTPWATCPLPPAQNKLALRVEAGEKTYHGPGAH